MLNCGQQKAEVAQEGQYEREGSRADCMFALLVERDQLKEFVHSETEGDQGGGGSNPGHHGAFVGEAGAFEGQFVGGFKFLRSGD